MPTLAQDIRSARQAVELLLDGMGVCGFTYTIEAKESGWVVRVECATDNGWQEATLPVDPAALGASLVDPDVRHRLRGDWEPHFRACMKRGVESANS